MPLSNIHLRNLDPTFLWPMSDLICLAGRVGEMQRNGHISPFYCDFFGGFCCYQNTGLHVCVYLLPDGLASVFTIENR